MNKLLEREKIATEKKCYVRINNQCNNNCIFCLDSASQTKDKIDKKEILAQIKKGKTGGATKLIISGGEATISPDFLEFLAYGKKLGYKKIQVITNGRMFAYPDFIEAAVKNGLKEITFSIHGQTKDLYEQLTNIPGSFEQIIKALTNARQYPELILNIDIVINKLNYKYLEDIIKFYSQHFSIFEYDLLQIIPYGRAMTNKELLFYDLEEALPYLRKVFDLAVKDKRFYIWTNRLPAKYLEGYEVLIQDPYKLWDEIRGRQELFTDYLEKNEKLSCQDEFRCQHCCLNDFCQKLALYKNCKNEKFFQLARWQQFSPSKLWFINFDRITLRELAAKPHWFDNKNLYVKIRNFDSLEDLENNALLFEQIRAEFGNQNLRFLNFPYCLIEKFNTIKYDFLFNYDRVVNDKKQIDLQKFTKHYLTDLYYVKSLRCSACKYDKVCAGWHINYLRYYGFKILKPIIK
jgi:MoaA/NifB/PqqE/SkfB family radical SAM enzyme